MVAQKMEETKNRIILSTAYLPNIQYFTKLLNGKIILEQHENYIKQTYRNRCEILTANGVMPITIPVKRSSGSKIKIKDVRIDHTDNWQRIHWKAITAAYNSSPFFEYYIDDFLPFFEKKEEFLFDFNYKLLQTLIELTGIKTDIILSYNFIPVETHIHDFRACITPKKQPEDIYFKPKPYYQVFSNKIDFMPNLSIIDLLFNEGNNTYSILRESLIL